MTSGTTPTKRVFLLSCRHPGGWVKTERFLAQVEIEPATWRPTPDNAEWLASMQKILGPGSENPLPMRLAPDQEPPRVSPLPIYFEI